MWITVVRRVLVLALVATCGIARADAKHPGVSLAGGHAKLACSACHDQGTTKPPSKGATCASCHADQHNGEFVALAKSECGKCHTVLGFAPTSFGVAQHTTTGYALEGKHAATPCSGCHRGARPRLSWLLAGTDCLDCHENPHGTQYAKEMVDGGCARCHSAVSWHAPKLDHASWPLAGAHARTGCAACHGAVKAGSPPAAFRGIARDCEGCHEDTHAGQFRQTAPVKPCESCHTADGFKLPAFDHATTRYPLEGAHVALACAACHPPATLRNGQTAIRWRLGYTRCKDCHKSPHEASP